jgi:WD40 repeat protein
VTISFDAWKEGKVAPTVHQLAVIAPRRKLALEDVSLRLKGSLIHANRQSQIVGIRYSADGKRLIAGDYPGGVVQLWDVESGRQLVKIETGYGYRSTDDYFFLSPDWKSVHTWREKRIPTRIEKDEKRIIHWKFEGEIRGWDLASGEPQNTLRQTPMRGIRWMTMSPDGSTFLVLEELPGDADGAPRMVCTLVDAKSGEFRELGNRDERLFMSGRFAADSRTVPVEVVDDDFNTTAFRIVDVATGTILRSLSFADEPFMGGWTLLSPSGKFLVTAESVVAEKGAWKDRRTRLRFRDLGTGDVLASYPLEEKESTVSALEFSPDGQTVAAVVSSTSRSMLLLFDAARQKLVHTVVVADEKAVNRTPAFSPDGRWLAAVTQVFPPETERDREPSAEDVPQPQIHLVDVATGVIRVTLIAPQGFTASVCFSPDGKTLASGGHGQVDLWNVEDVVHHDSRAKGNTP